MVGGDHTDNHTRDIHHGLDGLLHSDTIAVEVGDNHEGKEFHQEEV